MKKCLHCTIGAIPMLNERIYFVWDHDFDSMPAIDPPYIFKFCPDCGHKNKEIEEYLK
jgi:hypothetical protein